MPSMLIGTIVFYHLILLSMTLNLPGGRMVSDDDDDYGNDDEKNRNTKHKLTAASLYPNFIGIRLYPTSSYM